MSLPLRGRWHPKDDGEGKTLTPLRYPIHVMEYENRCLSKKIIKGVDRGQVPFLPSMGGCHAKRANAVCDQMKLGYISVLVAYAPCQP